MKKLGLNYYDVFIKNTEYSSKATSVLKDYIEHFKMNKSAEIEEKVHALEREADKSQHEILNYLVRDFIPPIDREDIIMLCHEIDNVMDCIDEVVININIYNVTKLAEDIDLYIDLLNRQTEVLVEMMKVFKTVKKRDQITDYIVKINNCEEEGDRLYQSSIKRMYENPLDTIEMIKWTTIYKCFENCFDAMENVCDVVDEIVMKNC